MHGEVVAVVDFNPGDVGQDEGIAKVELERSATGNESRSIMEFGRRRGSQIFTAGRRITDVHVAGGAEVKAKPQVIHSRELAQIQSGLTPVPAQIDNFADVTAITGLLAIGGNEHPVVEVRVGGEQRPVRAVVGDVNTETIKIVAVFRVRVVVKVEGGLISRAVTFQAEGSACQTPVGTAGQIIRHEAAAIAILTGRKVGGTGLRLVTDTVVRSIQAEVVAPVPFQERIITLLWNTAAIECGVNAVSVVVFTPGCPVPQIVINW